MSPCANIFSIGYKLGIAKESFFAEYPDIHTQINNATQKLERIKCFEPQISKTHRHEKTRFGRTMKTDPVAHPNSYTVSTGCLSRG